MNVAHLLQLLLEENEIIKKKIPMIIRIIQKEPRFDKET